MNILSIETSCDETAIAIVRNGTEILSSTIASQIKTHEIYGGVVPEIASRQHCEHIDKLTKICINNAKINLSQIDCVAVTFAPGLVGSLLVGINFAKSLSFTLNKPLVAVHHLRSHIAANYLTYPNLEPPFLALIVSGGHSIIVKVNNYCSFEVVGKTHDDAVGETFDKIARAMGLTYPGGSKLEELAKLGNETRFNLPNPKIKNSEFDFSFSGLKTAVLNILNSNKNSFSKTDFADLAASFQKTICNILLERTFLALKKFGFKKLAMAGGVCCNQTLRQLFQKKASETNVKLYIPHINLCQDNGAMVGAQAFFEFQNNNVADFDLNASAKLDIDYI